MRFPWQQQQQQQQEREEASRPSIPTSHKHIFDCLIAEQHLHRVVAALGSSIFDLFALARVNRALWDALAGEHKLWREVYLDNDPLVTPDIR